jgi:hypothetical protein
MRINKTLGKQVMYVGEWLCEAKFVFYCLANYLRRMSLIALALLADSFEGPSALKMPRSFFELLALLARSWYLRLISNHLGAKLKKLP